MYNETIQQKTQLVAVGGCGQAPFTTIVLTLFMTK